MSHASSKCITLHLETRNRIWQAQLLLYRGCQFTMDTILKLNENPVAYPVLVVMVTAFF